MAFVRIWIHSVWGTKNRHPYLVNGIKLQGQIESFDQYVILLRNTVTQMVYKHAISTIVPGRAVNFSSIEGLGDPVDATDS